MVQKPSHATVPLKSKKKISTFSVSEGLFSSKTLHLSMLLLLFSSIQGDGASKVDVVFLLISEAGGDCLLMSEIGGDCLCISEIGGVCLFMSEIGVVCLLLLAL
jgi:hypothetical protein